MEYVIFGAGILGRELLKKLGKENVKCFIDNDRNKQGMFLDEIPVYSYEYYKCQLSLYPIIICASWVNIFKIVEQLKQDYIDYKICDSLHPSPKKVTIRSPLFNSVAE